MYSGYVGEWYDRLQSFKDLDHKLKILVGGNHDRHLEMYSGPACAELRDTAGVYVLGAPRKQAKLTLPNGMTVLGLPFVSGLPLWSFDRGEEWLWDYLDGQGRVDIVVSHSPPAGIMDSDGKGHYGIKAYRKYLSKFQPKIWICGHVHEAYGRKEVEGCMFYSAAMCNEDYKQVNEPFVIDV